MIGVLEKISKIFSTLPNLGPKSAQKVAINLAYRPKVLAQLIVLLQNMLNSIGACSKCNNLCENNCCQFCNSTFRNHDLICIVDNILNLYAIESTNQYNGIYYLLHEETKINEEKLINLINDGEQKECIIALNSTLEGQAKSYYLQALLAEYKNVSVSSLSVGIPMGVDLNFLDSGTLSFALHFRKNL